ncbi:hypothetical protein PR048_019526, partial [Dryococelus australis]
MEDIRFQIGLWKASPTREHVITLYNSNAERFVKAENNALLILTTNMTEDTLEKVMRFSTTREVW